MLQLGQSLSLQVLELSSGGQAEEGVEGVTIDIEGGHTSWSCNTELVLEEKSEAVDQVGLPCTSRARDNHPQSWGVIGCLMLLDDGVHLFSLQVERIGCGGEYVLSSRLSLLRDE